MPTFNDDIVALTKANDDFRRVVVTGERGQVVLMAVAVGDEIGEEVHDHNDQILSFVEGRGEAIIDGEVGPVGPGALVYVPAGTRHNFRNTGDEPLRLYTVYAPPEHPDGTVHHTKADADAAEHH